MFVPECGEQEKKLAAWQVTAQDVDFNVVNSGKVCKKKHGTSQFLMGKSTISMAMFKSYVSLPGCKLKIRNHPKIHRILQYFT